MTSQIKLSKELDEGVNTDKYYTPSIEEFYVGFEFEWSSKIRKEPFHFEMCDVDLISIIYDEYEHEDEEELFKNQFRVKYLDKEDIESLGFKYTDKTITENILITQYFEYKDYIISFIDRANNVQITKLNNLGAFTLFSGTIKNKSELKLLLKQVGIDE